MNHFPSRCAKNSIVDGSFPSPKSTEICQVYTETCFLSSELKYKIHGFSVPLVPRSKDPTLPGETNQPLRCRQEPELSQPAWRKSNGRRHNVRTRGAQAIPKLHIWKFCPGTRSGRIRLNNKQFVMLLIQIANPNPPMGLQSC